MTDWATTSSLATAGGTLVSQRSHLLCGENEGGQHIVTRIMLVPLDDDRWIANVVRHWNLDRADPR